MRRINFVLAALAILLALGLTACSTTGTGGRIGGTFTLTDIPPYYDGMYAMLQGIPGDLENPERAIEDWEIGEGLSGWQSFNLNPSRITLCRISNGSVDISLWHDDLESIPYTGNGYFGVSVTVHNSQVVSINDEYIAGKGFSLTFSNGNAAKSWNEGVSFY